MKVITIGRSRDNCVIVEDEYAGRHHCQITQHDNGTFYLLDKNSTNGTFVNGRQIKGEVMLNQTDTVRIGKTTLPWQTYFRSGGKSDRATAMTTITIGRGDNNDFVIPDNRVSRAHVQIIKDDNGNFRIVDVGSKNGTYVNGRKIAGETILNPIDVVRIGNTTLRWKDYFTSKHPDGDPTDAPYPPDDEPPISDPIPTPTPTPTPNSPYSIWVLISGLISFGLVAYIIINYFTSFGAQIAGLFGGMEGTLKLFPIYLKGYFGIGGQWVPIIAALVLGIVADFIYGAIDIEQEDRIAKAGKAFANIAITIAAIFLLLAIFADKIVGLY